MDVENYKRLRQLEERIILDLYDSELTLQESTEISEEIRSIMRSCDHVIPPGIPEFSGLTFVTGNPMCPLCLRDKEET